MRGRHDNITVRQGTSERNWYPIAGYIAVAILGILYVLSVVVSMSGSPQATFLSATVLVMVIAVLSFLGLIVYPAIFRDSAYLRGTRGGWRPKWWNYTLGGIGVPIVVFFGGAVFLSTSEGLMFAFLLHSISAPAASVHYLYKRHKFVGVP